ncbi:M20 metallopeptidase family protein [Anaeromicrobium sediminis]|uniref:Peptidase M20 dimerisation domain-containing protein n=1 Tax=Anaeromicrobium sediminis TaxID=1478221 RepID=A0A267MIU8_9FIRM|nr:M20 family metallopeptidase [Anaeromicrobium sediminis]PAB59456.1 hypothetical protein CCE28_09575 [Anaeromicrobium sediminis]
MIRVDNHILELRKEIINIRRKLHEMPEIGFEEYETSEFIKNKLKENGIEVHENVAKTGLVGVIRVNDLNDSIGFRADMDALNIEEETNLDFKSKNENMMHACGHDAHMSISLGFAIYLSKNRDKLNKNVVFIYQPAEEGPGGAEVMIEEGIMEKFHISEVIGLHVFPNIEEGYVACKEGALMARCGEFDIDIYGLGSHGAYPHKGIDSIVIMANLINTIQSITSRNINSNESAVVTIGRAEAGERRNIIAQDARLEGTIRVSSEEVYETIKKRLKEIIRGFEITYDCKIELELRDMYPAVMNDKDLVNDLVLAVGKENYIPIEFQMISEDFSFFQRKCRGVFFFLGIKNEEKGCVYPLHSSKFCFNEEILLMGVQVYKNILKAKKYFKGE